MIHYLHSWISLILHSCFYFRHCNFWWRSSHQRLQDHKEDWKEGNMKNIFHVFSLKVFNDWFREWEPHQEMQDNIINFVQKKTSFKRTHLYIYPLLAPIQVRKRSHTFFQGGIDYFFNDSLFFLKRKSASTKKSISIHAEFWT